MQPPHHHYETSTPRHAKAVIETVYDAMLMTYGKLFIDQWGYVPPHELKAYWATQLSGLSATDIARGLAALPGRSWPPSLPEFMLMCRPPIEPLAAYYEALRGVRARKCGEIGDWSHPAIYWAAVPMAYEIESQTWAQIKPAWEASLTRQLARGAWEPIPPAVLAIAFHGQQRERSAAAEHALHALKAKGGFQVTRQKRDPLAWAHDIIARAERGGDQYTTLTVVEMAQRAIGTKR